jgi:hypothetical protein
LWGRKIKSGSIGLEKSEQNIIKKVDLADNPVKYMRMLIEGNAIPGSKYQEILLLLFISVSHLPISLCVPISRWYV